MRENTGLGREIDDALTELSDLCCDGVPEWFSELWDPAIGGFYCSESARDHEGFLPDIESTNQILNFCGGSLFEHPSQDKKAYIPISVKEKLVNFVCSLADADGYIYHPQWGREISSERRERDLSSASSLAKSLGFSLPFSKSGDEASRGCSKSTLPEHLQSREAFVRYLDGLNIGSNTHKGGNLLQGQCSRISSAGLSDVLIDYLDELQRKTQTKLRESGKRENGCWQSETDYVSISGLYKLGNIYKGAGRVFNYGEELVDSAMEVILSDVMPDTVVQVYNPWVGLRVAIENMRLSNDNEPGRYDLDKIFEKIRGKAPDMIKKTKEKLKVFKKNHGFSYYPDIAAPYSQGAHVSVGVSEGEVNASVIAINGVRRSIYAALGISSPPPVWRAEELSAFFRRIEARAPIKKMKVPRKYKNDPPVLKKK